MFNLTQIKDTMFQIPQSVVENLRCSVCEGYLSTKPVMIMKGNKSVCGKCYKILPEEEKTMCVRQASFEVLGDIMLFPCKFHKMGCSYTFNWNDPNSHEAECLFRYFNFINHHSPENDDNNKITTKPKEITYENDLIKAQFKYEVKENKYDKDFKNLLYQLNIQGSFGKILSIKDIFTSQEQNDISYNLEGAVSLRNSPEIIYSDIKIQPLSENIYATLNPGNNPIGFVYDIKVCVNCNMSVQNNSYTTCGLGHLSCLNCKDNTCRACLRSLTGSMDSIVGCKNYFKGCRERLDSTEAGKHHNDCEYNNIHCPIEKCDLVDNLPNLKLHLKQNHDNVVFRTNEYTRTYGPKDTTTVMYCYDNVFKCVYFNYETFVDFYVTLLGASEKALNFSFEISVQSTKGVVTKKCRCSNWHDSMLAKGVSFEKKDLTNSNGKRFSFEINLRILRLMEIQKI